MFKRNNYRGLLACLAALAVAVIPTISSAQAALPATGVDVAQFVTLVITSLGLVAGAVVGGYFAFLLIKMGMRWGRRVAG